MVMNVFLHSFESVHSVLALFTMCAALLPVSQKRFSLEGAEALIPMIDAIFEDASSVIATALKKSFAQNNSKTHIAKTSFEIALKQLV